MDMEVHMPLRQWFTSFRSTFRCGSYDSSVFHYVRLCLTTFYNICTDVPSHQWCVKFSFTLTNMYLKFLITSILTGMGDNSIISNSHLSNTSDFFPCWGKCQFKSSFVFTLDYVGFSCLFWRLGGYISFIFWISNP